MRWWLCLVLVVNAGCTGLSPVEGLHLHSKKRWYQWGSLATPLGKETATDSTAKETAPVVTPEEINVANAHEKVRELETEILEEEAGIGKH